MHITKSKHTHNYCSSKQGTLVVKVKIYSLFKKEVVKRLIRYDTLRYYGLIHSKLGTDLLNKGENKNKHRSNNNS